MGLALALLAVALAGPALATKKKPPVPRPKPAIALEGARIPLPRPRPKRDKAGLVVEPPDAAPESGPGAAAIANRLKREAGDGGNWSANAIAVARLECARQLAGLDLIWVPDKPFGGPGACGTPAPIAVSEIAGIRLNPPATVNCPMAAALHRWLKLSVLPAARRDIGQRLTEIRVAASYACRSRNNVRGAKLSEHGLANALDISAFVFGEGREVTVAGDWSGFLQMIGASDRGNFLRVVRRDSCEYFSTVLGPGSDPYHGDHFHIDLAQRRNRGKYCR